jgi:hypothetical protein
MAGSGTGRRPLSESERPLPSRRRFIGGAGPELPTAVALPFRANGAISCIRGLSMTITGLGDLAQWLQVAQSVVAITGLPILILTLLMIWRQALYAHHAAMSQVYQNTADNFATVQRYFMENPQYRLYFYDGKCLDRSDIEYMRISAIAEFFLHAVHNLTIHSRYMREYPWHVWEKSLRDIYNNGLCTSIRAI